MPDGRCIVSPRHAAPPGRSRMSSLRRRDFPSCDPVRLMGQRQRARRCSGVCRAGNVPARIAAERRSQGWRHIARQVRTAHARRDGRQPDAGRGNRAHAWRSVGAAARTGGSGASCPPTRAGDSGLSAARVHAWDRRGGRIDANTALPIADMVGMWVEMIEHHCRCADRRSREKGVPRTIQEQTSDKVGKRLKMRSKFVRETMSIGG